MYYLLVFGFVAVGAFAVLKSTTAEAAQRRLMQPDTTGVSYSKRRQLLSAAEQTLFQRLRQAVAGDAYILAKVPLGDLVEVGGAPSSRAIARSRVERRNVDFVVIGRDSYSPLLVVELDESLQRWDLRQQDRLVDNVLTAAGLPVVHVQARRDWDVADLSDYITAGLMKVPRAAGR